jgi:hypothetical protein
MNEARKKRRTLDEASGLAGVAEGWSIHRFCTAGRAARFGPI